MIADRARGVAIGAHAEEAVLADFEHVGDFIEDFGDFVVLHRHHPRTRVCPVPAYLRVNPITFADTSRAAHSRDPAAC